MTHEELTAFAAEVKAAHALLDLPGNGPGSPAWDAWFGDNGIKARWTGRPHGRAAAPGDLALWQLPGEWPHGGDVRCRRCNAECSLDGHPEGCPRTPADIGEWGQALRYCYCGQTLVVPPDTFGECCADTPPVSLPGGCRYCGSSECRVNVPDDLPEKTFYIEARRPEMGDAWVHARCLDDHLAGRGREDEAARRRAERQVPIGIIGQ